jgi:hypothetical protein
MLQYSPMTASPRLSPTMRVMCTKCQLPFLIFQNGSLMANAKVLAGGKVVRAECSGQGCHHSAEYSVSQIRTEFPL